MAEHDSPLIHAQKFGATLTTPVFVVDRDGTLLYYNKAAEHVLGRTFDETGSMAASTWSRLFLPTDEAGMPLMPETLPLMVALNESHPAYGTLWIRGIDNVQRCISVAAFPITDERPKLIGAVAFFWENSTVQK
jgi:PAS domain-containing protein